MRRPETSVEELKAMLSARRSFFLLDVREPCELEICRLPGARNIPLGELSARFGELKPSDEIVVMCRSGRRSAQAVEFLLGKGFARCSNLAGGILAWARRIDPSMRTY